MSAADNPNLQAVPDPNRQLPPAELSPTVSSVAEWAGRTQARVGQFFTSAFHSSRDGSASFVRTVRDRSRRIKEENPLALLGGIAGTAFAVGVAARVLRSKR